MYYVIEKIEPKLPIIVYIQNMKDTFSQSIIHIQYISSIKADMNYYSYIFLAKLQLKCDSTTSLTDDNYMYNTHQLRIYELYHMCV